MNFIKFGNILIFVSAALMVASIAALAMFGLNLGIEFTGGSLLEVQYQAQRPANNEIREYIVPTGVQVSSVQPVGEKGVIIRMADISEDQHQQVVRALGSDITEQRFESIGPVIGKELRDKAFILVGFALLAIALYVAFAFRKVTRPVSFWQWSAVTLIALLHDILLPLGMLALLGEFQNVSFTIPVVVALLTVVGYSVNDTVVIFDRIRENLVKKVGFDFADTVNKGLQQTMSRSINTSFTTLLVVLAILFFGGETLYDFALTLAVGIAAGAWSSLFVAPPLLVRWAQKAGG